MDIQKEFLDVFDIDDNIKALTLHLFLSMLPLHNDFKEKQMAFLSNTFMLYDTFLRRAMIIIFPMAGLSSRFAKAGYDKPKYMLDLKGNSVFFHAVNSFKNILKF